MFILFRYHNDAADVLGNQIIGLVLITLIVCAALMLQVFLHELGHVIFGKLSGYRFMGMSVFGYWLLRTDNGMRFKFFPMKGAGGGTLSLPEDGYKKDTPHTMFYLGGVLMNILVTVLFTAMFLMDISPMMNCLAAAVMITGVFFILNNSIPMTEGFVINDMAMLRLFRRDGATGDCTFFVAKMTFLIMSGSYTEEYMRNVPSDLPYGNRMAEIVRVNIIHYHLRNMRLDLAEENIHELLSGIGSRGRIKNIMDLHLMVMYAVRGEDKRKIDDIYDRKMRKFVRSIIKNEPEALLFLIAYEKRFGAGDPDAYELMHRFEKLVKRNEAGTVYERYMMESLLSNSAF
ncbi:MAG: site-2 protease family protein [Methanomassiliicoccaceae archaeon]|nr:site-2 protease family protein [Methanomassiliicoccaceae archaeon]